MKYILIFLILNSGFLSLAQEVKPKCLEGNCKNKIGTYLYSDSSIYVGSFSDKLRSGQGKITYKSGATYEGEWVNDKRQGQGIFIDSLKNKYEGSWIEDKENGVGKYTDAKGNVYEGTWTNGELKGYITLRYKNKNLYQGEYDKGIRGKGKFTYADGSVYNGNFAKNKRSGYGELIYHFGLTYKGNWVSNEIEGQGEFFETKSQNKVASGSWKTEKSDAGHLIYISDNGFMVCYYKNKDLYYGQVSKGLPSGNGMMVYSNGDVYEGMYTAGQYNGYGHLLYKDKSEYKGEWKNGLRDGLGTFVKIDKSEEKGYWEKGKYIGVKKPNLTLSSDVLESSGMNILYNIVPTNAKIFSLRYSPYISYFGDCYGFINEYDLTTRKQSTLRRRISEDNTNTTCEESIYAYHNNTLLNQTNILFQKQTEDNIIVSEKIFNKSNGSFTDKQWSLKNSFEILEGGNIATYTLRRYQIGNGFGIILAKHSLDNLGFLFIHDYLNNRYIKIDLSGTFKMYKHNGEFTYEFIENGKKISLPLASTPYLATQNDKYYYVFLEGNSHIVPVRINKTNNQLTVMHEFILNMGSSNQIPNTNIYERNHGLFFLPYTQGFAHHYYLKTEKTNWQEYLKIDIYDKDFNKVNTIDVETDKNIKWIYEKDNYLVIGGFTLKSGYLGYSNPWIRVINTKTKSITYDKVIAYKNYEISNITSNGEGVLFIGINPKCCENIKTNDGYKPLIIIDKINLQGGFENNLSSDKIASDNFNKKVNTTLVEDSKVESKIEQNALRVEPEFSGGYVSMLSFIQNNLKYPTVDLANNVSGKVEVTFTVQSDGSLTNIKITKGLTETTNNEVIRVFKLMPKWIAGTIDGKKSNLEVTIPVTFSF